MDVSSRCNNNNNNKTNTDNAANNKNKNNTRVSVYRMLFGRMRDHAAKSIRIRSVKGNPLPIVQHRVWGRGCACPRFAVWTRFFCERCLELMREGLVVCCAFCLEVTKLITGDINDLPNNYALNELGRGCCFFIFVFFFPLYVNGTTFPISQKMSFSFYYYEDHITPHNHQKLS